MWFEKLTGFKEGSPNQVRSNIEVIGEKLVSRANNRELFYGFLETPNLHELREQVASLDLPVGKISLNECISDSHSLHKKVENNGATFQVASQFNLLEMTAPDVTPEDGIDGYEYDSTQGPACAIAAGAGTIYRQYFVELNGRTGQSEDNQLDMLADMGKELGNTSGILWRTKNGYAMASSVGLKEVSRRLQGASESEIDALRKLLRVGIQWNTEVTISEHKNRVSQVYCSALPVSYSEHTSEQWQDFACLILEASYEATICAGILNAAKTGNARLYLTLVGGGVFGNEYHWITRAIKRALDCHRNVDLDVYIVSFRESNQFIAKLVDEFQ